MNFKEIQELIKLVAKAELSEFKMKDGEFKIHLRGKDYSSGGKDNPAPIINMNPAPAATYSAPAPAPAPAPAAAPAATPDLPAAPEAEPAGNYKEVKSPMIGTFYRSSSPDKDAYVKIGDTVSAGDTVCIIEAMKLFNEIETEISGKIVKVMVEDAQPVEYDQVLFLVDPAG